jgi:MYXO-CTERM domain-containing protein
LRLAAAFSPVATSLRQPAFWLSPKEHPVNRTVGALFALILAGAPAVALAQPVLIDTLGGPQGYGTQCLSPNDDGSSNAIDLTAAFPGGLEFFGRRHTVAYVNTNGNITFAGPLSTFTPTAFPVADRPSIAPYWADVDIRGASCSGIGGGAGCANPTSNGVWWSIEPGRMVVTWDHVGYFSCADALQMNFQLIMTESRYCGIAGDFDVEFRYNLCEWETGTASGGTGGFGGTPAQVGFDAGNLTDFVSITGSRLDGISRVVCDDSNVGEPGVWRFRIRRGVVECPDAGNACPIPDAVGVCAEGRTQCRGSSVVCLPIVAASAERCDAFDNDCDGLVDEDPNLCGAVDICDRGRCITPCFEGGCATGFTCSDTGVCLEDACTTVTCAAGERCVAGACVGVCGGVVCPPGRDCVGGSCQDLCAVVSCGSCEVCDSGNCRTRCEVTGCPTGQACEETGVCVEEACYGILCAPGRVCRAGLCASACDGVVCPSGEVCLRGECRPPVVIEPDAGTPDAGPLNADAGPDAGRDPVDLGRPDGGRISPPAPKDPGCGCTVPGESRGSAGGGLLALAALGLALVVRRRRALLPFLAALALGALASACTVGERPITTNPTCGDGLVATDETCDDDNTADGDGCDARCAIEFGWECTGEPSVCARISLGVCGDGMVGGTEQCDDSGPSAECDGDCTLVACGDGVLNTLASEECDDGNTIDGDGCTSRCFAEPDTCGNGPCEAGETCNNCGADCALTPLCLECPDLDGDGARDDQCGGTDCNDEDPNVSPAMVEIPCNRIDDDCSAATRDALDVDLDGSSCNFDCDDNDPARSPLLRELCGDGIDNDCDDTTPDLFDFDGDGAMCDVDCDDYRATTCPTCPELCGNTIDDDCNPATLDLFDADGDGSVCNVDCDDSNPARRPGGAELCDGIDNNCNGLLDGVNEDDDRDGYADTAACGAACVGRCGDCVDTNAAVHPGALEICGNTIDDDCDPATSDALVDLDGDGAMCDVDCNDHDATVFPNSAGVCGPRFSYFEDFEAGAGGWTASGTASTWAYGTPAATFISHAASGTSAWVTNLTGNYNNSELSYLTSPPLDLSAVFGEPQLSFSHIFTTESCCDEGWVEVSTNGGTLWNKVGASGSGSNWYNYVSGQYWNGSSGLAGIWRTASIRLTGVAGQADVRLRFVMSSDGSVQYEGFGVDDVRLDNQLADLALMAVNAAPSVACAGVSTPIRATVRNDGITTVGSFDIAYTIDAGTPVTETVTHTLRPGESFEYTFTAPAVLAGGSHTVSVTLALAGDTVTTNDTRSVDVAIEPIVAIVTGTPYTEGFEVDAGGWTTSGAASSWARGTPAATYLVGTVVIPRFISAAGAGTQAWVTNPTGSYNNNELSYLLSPCFDFSGVSADPTVSFLHIYKTAAGDRGWLEVTRDGSTWTKLGIVGDGTNWYSDAVNEAWSGTSGASGVWRTATRNVETVSGLPLVRFRFVFSSDVSSTSEGFAVDDFTITP